MTTKFTEIFIVFIMVAILLLYVRQYYGEVVYERSNVDGRKYLVRKLADRKEAADLLAKVNEDLTALVRHMVARFGTEDAAVHQLYQNYDPDALSEGGTEVGYTSYSVNKGEKIVLCLRQKDNTLVDQNTIMYVAVHELGHLMTDEVGHTPKFWSNFKWLLKEAIDLGIYERVDYSADPHMYCGIEITSSVV